jgi:cytochrome c oxidase subunit IV
MSGAMSVEEVKKHVKVYLVIFGALLILTGVTVFVGYQEFPLPVAVGVALLVASVKGSLVALYFMHLIDEKKIVYYTLALTAVMLVFLMCITIFI